MTDTRHTCNWHQIAGEATLAMNVPGGALVRSTERGEDGQAGAALAMALVPGAVVAKCWMFDAESKAWSVRLGLQPGVEAQVDPPSLQFVEDGGRGYWGNADEPLFDIPSWLAMWGRTVRGGVRPGGQR